MTQTADSKSQVEKLKSLLLALKQKHDKVVAELKEKEGLANALRRQTELFSEEKEENGLLQGQITTLREKLILGEQKYRQLESHLKEMQNRKFDGVDQTLAEQMRQMENSLERERGERLKSESLLQESRKHAEQLERATQFLRERAEAANLELNQLRGDFQNMQTSFDQCDDQLKSARTENDQLLDRNKSLERLEQELNRVKQTLIRALREAQEMELQHQAVVEEKVGLIGKCRQMQGQLDKEREQKDLINTRLETEKATHTELREQVVLWQRECDKTKREAEEGLELQKTRLEEEKALVRQREASILDLQRQVGLLRHEGEKVRDEMALTSAEISDKEKEMQEAQQHLARKVKEVAELEIRCEGRQRQNEELQQILNDSKVRIAELQTGCDMHEAQRQRMQEQLQEAIKAYEALQAKWENKYLALHEKWQNAEGRLKELEKLEERYKQLQGFFLMPTKAPEVIVETIQEPVKELPKDLPKEPPKEFAKQGQNEAPKPFSNLFDLPKSTTRPKQNLLD
ncbi:MAG: hypothetical protein LLG04_02495 [Parachlamydia sp.]|nr:hypothetical protein [Parachlamydia sp.]